MRYRKQTINPRSVLPDDDVIDPAAIAAQIRDDARSTLTHEAVGDALRGEAPPADDVPIIPLDLSEEELTYHPQTPRFQPSGSFSQPLRAAPPGVQRLLAPPAQPTPTPAAPAANAPVPPPTGAQAMPPQGQPETIQHPPPNAAPQAQPQTPPMEQMPPSNAANEPPAQSNTHDPEEALVPTEGGMRRPEAAPPLLKANATGSSSLGDRARKMANLPGAFGPTADEEARLARAERADLRSDRTRRALGALSGIARGFAGVVPFLFPVAAGLEAGQGAVREHNSRQNEVQGQIARRMQQMQSEREAANQAAGVERQGINDQREAERNAARDALAARQAEADIGLTNARTQAEASEQTRGEAEQAMATRGAAGLRDYIRARVAAIPNGPTRAPLEATVNAEGFNGIEDPEALYRVLSSVDAVDRRRGGQGVGGSGGSSSQVFDPTTGRMTTVRTGGGGGGGGRTGGGAPAPSGTPGTPPQRMTLPNVDERLQRAFEHVYGPVQNEDGTINADRLAALTQMRDDYEAAGTGRQDRVRTWVADTLARAGGNNRLPVNVDAREWGTLTHEAREVTNRIQRLQPLRNSLSGANPEVLRAALHGGDALAAVAGATRLRAQIQTYLNEYFHDFGGANITPEERARYLSAFAAGTAIADPSEFTATMRRVQQANLNEARGILGRATNSDTDAMWEHYVNTVLHQRGRR